MKSRIAVSFFVLAFLLAGVSACAALPAGVTSEPASALRDVPKTFATVSQTQGIGGVDVWIGGIGLLSWPDAVEVSPELAQLAGTYTFLENASVVGVLTVGSTNRSPNWVRLHPEQGTLSTGSEKVYFGSFPDVVGGESWPGATKGGPLFFILENTTWDDVAAGIDLVYETVAATDIAGQPLADQSYRFVLHVEP